MVDILIDGFMFAIYFLPRYLILRLIVSLYVVFQTLDGRTIRVNAAEERPRRNTY